MHESHTHTPVRVCVRLTDEVGDGPAVGEPSGGAAEECGPVRREIRLNAAVRVVAIVSGVEDRVPEDEDRPDLRSGGGNNRRKEEMERDHQHPPLHFFRNKRWRRNRKS